MNVRECAEFFAMIQHLSGVDISIGTCAIVEVLLRGLVTIQTTMKELHGPKY